MAQQTLVYQTFALFHSGVTCIPSFEVSDPYLLLLSSEGHLYLILPVLETSRVCGFPARRKLSLIFSRESVSRPFNSYSGWKNLGQRKRSSIQTVMTRTATIFKPARKGLPPNPWHTFQRKISIPLWGEERDVGRTVYRHQARCC